MRRSLERRTASVGGGVRACFVVVVLTIFGLSSSPSVATASGVSCQQYEQTGIVPASLVPTAEGLPYTIDGELCATASERRAGTTVQLLVHGATYNHSYWDFGTIDGIQYSYARHLASAGFPTFAIDLIGSGQSSKPPSSDLTTAVVAYVEHDALQGLESGSLTGTRFGKVVEVGHSGGSAATLQEAITYGDADGLIITGLTHHFSQAGATDLAADMYPANADAKFSGLAWVAGDSGYLTTVPGTRGEFFYNGADADPHVIAADDNETPFGQESFSSESGKDVYSSTLFDGMAIIDTTATRAIQVPVLLIVGAKDGAFCGPDANGLDFDCSSGAAIVRQETPDYSPQAQLEACSVPNAGHDVALHLNFAIEEAASISWSEHFIGQRGRFGGGALPSACG